MRVLLFFYFLLASFYSFAQETYSISGRIFFPHEEDKLESRPITILIKNSSGNLVGGNIDSNLYFNICCLTNGKYTLYIDSSQSFFSFKSFDTLLVIDNNSITNVEVKTTTICSRISKEIAENDISNGYIILLMEPGYVRFRYSHKERRIMKRYHISYSWSGCFRFDYHSCLKEYNNVVFAYLDKKYGLKWRAKVLGNVVGLK